VKKKLTKHELYVYSMFQNHGEMTAPELIKKAQENYNIKINRGTLNQVCNLLTARGWLEMVGQVKSERRNMLIDKWRVRREDNMIMGVGI